MSDQSKENDNNSTSIAEGDFILVDYVGRSKGNNEIFDVTIEEVARKEGVWREDIAYRPELCIVGSNFLVSGLEKELIDMKVDSSATIEVQPEDAFGKRDATKIEMIPARALIEETKSKPEVGRRVRYKGKIGRIISASQGRCRVDFNHPLAGKQLIFDAKVHERLETTDDKLKALVSRRIPREDLANFKIEFNEETKDAVVDIPFRLLGAEGIDYALLGLASDLWRHMGFEKVQITQTFDFTSKETEGNQEEKSTAEESLEEDEEKKENTT